MTKGSRLVGRARVSFSIAGGIAMLAAMGCGEITGGDVTTTGEIIGGSAPLDINTRRLLGLVEWGCSGALIRKDFVLTASHCIAWSSVPSMAFSIVRPDGAYDQRLGSYAVQVGSSDIAMVKLAPGAAGNMWPNISHPVTTATAASFVGTDITCYGEGANAYKSGGGITGYGTYMSLTKHVESLSTDDPVGGEYFTVTSPDGQHVLSWGDSGANCFTSNSQVLAVHSGGNCSNWVGMGQPNGPACNGDNVIAQKDNFLRATASWRSYMTEALTRAGTTFELLPLSNGWKAAAFGANGPGATNVGGVVTLRGAISSGTTQQPFTLPAAYAPSGRVYVPVATTNNTIGRLIIETTGAVAIECEGDGGFCGNSSSFTSLDGVSYVQNATGATDLTLLNGWSAATYGNRAPAVKVVNGQAHFIGGMLTSGTTALAFQLPVALRPTYPAWVPVSLCWSAKGRLNIETNGNVSVQVESGGNWGSAQCFTSLEGASFAPSLTSFQSVGLENGWLNGAFGADAVRFRNDNGVVRFKGAAWAGTAAKIVTLTTDFRPATNVWLYVDAYNGKRARLKIAPDGSVTLDPPGALADAQSFLSFEGAKFGI
jgi:Trypsin